MIRASHTLMVERCPTWMDRLIRRLVLARLRRSKCGEIVVEENGSVTRVGEAGDLTATVRVYDPRVFSRLLLGGSLAAADAYIHGQWDCDDLTTLFRLMSSNKTIQTFDGRWMRIGNWLKHLLNRNSNSRRGSRKNIGAHYDLGNDFFRLWLDDTWAYSCGIFSSPDVTLRDASLEKFDRACRKLNLQPNDHLLEIGTGWGGLAIRAGREYGCRVTSTTISRQQFELSSQRIQEAGLLERVTLLSEDYRDLSGKFDKLISIEMIEAVGHEYLDTYFRKCGELLKPDGSMLLQAIVMPDRGYRKYLNSVDFIRCFVFPGGCLPSVGSILDSVARTTQMRLVHLEDMSPHYAHTLRHWRTNVHNRRSEIRNLGYTDEFLRMWDYYLSYCEAGFEERGIGVVQMVFENSCCRQDPLIIGQQAVRARGFGTPGDNRGLPAKRVSLSNAAGETR